MKRVVLFFVLMLAAAFFSTSVLHAENIVKKAPEKGLLKITVFSSTNNKPLAGVKLTAKMGKTVFHAVTDKNGFASLSLPAGTWQVTLTLKGWQPQSNKVKIESGRFVAYKVKFYPAGSKPGGASWIPSTGGLVPGRF